MFIMTRAVSAPRDVERRESGSMFCETNYFLKFERIEFVRTTDSLLSPPFHLVIVKIVPAMQLAAHDKCSALCSWSYGVKSKFFRLHGLLLFCIIIATLRALRALLLFLSKCNKELVSYCPSHFICSPTPGRLPKSRLNKNHSNTIWCGTGRHFSPFQKAQFNTNTCGCIKWKVQFFIRVGRYVAFRYKWSWSFFLD